MVLICTILEWNYLLLLNTEFISWKTAVQGRASASRTKDAGFVSRDERILTLGFFQTNGASTG